MRARISRSCVPGYTTSSMPTLLLHLRLGCAGIYDTYGTEYFADLPQQLLQSIQRQERSNVVYEFDTLGATAKATAVLPTSAMSEGWCRSGDTATPHPLLHSTIRSRLGAPSTARATGTGITLRAHPQTAHKLAVILHCRQVFRRKNQCATFGALPFAASMRLFLLCVCVCASLHQCLCMCSSVYACSRMRVNVLFGLLT